MLSHRSTRREFLRRSAVSGLGLSLAGLACVREKRPPNVLMISVDDLNSWVGCLGGHPQALTPNLDGLASRGRLFSRAYSPATTCNGTRSAVLTGLRPSQSLIFDNSSPMVPDDALTLPVHFRNHGYRAIAGGKVFHHYTGIPWDEFYVPKTPEGTFEARTKPDEYGFPWEAMLNWGPIKMADKKTWDGQLADWAVQQLHKEHSQPLFLAVGLFQPHLPWFIPRKYFRPFRPDRVKLPPWLWNDLNDIGDFARSRVIKNDFVRIANWGQWEEAVSSYLAATYFMDTMLGKVLNALDESPMRDNTIVALWSDHGFHLGQKSHWHKYVLWEPGTRIPFVLSVPGMSRMGEPSGRPVDLMHLYPTLVDLCGLPLPEGVDLAGRSLRPLLEDPEADWDLPAITTSGYRSSAVRTVRWRYISYVDGSEELYDLDADPNEWTNLAGDPSHAAVIAEHARWLPQVGEDPAV